MKKEEMRKICKEKIKMLRSENFVLYGKAMTKIVTETSEWKNAKTVFVYVSLPNEADTSGLIAAALEQGKRLCVPKITGEGVMKAIELKSTRQLQKGKFGIFEPDETGAEVPKNKIDLIILPCLAADKSGARLGKGGGYYDRFCENFEGSKLILCCDELLFDEETIPTQKWDVYADVVTQNEIVRKLDND